MSNREIFIPNENFTTKHTLCLVPPSSQTAFDSKLRRDTEQFFVIAPKQGGYERSKMTSIGFVDIFRNHTHKIEHGSWNLTQSRKDEAANRGIHSLTHRRWLSAEKFEHRLLNAPINHEVDVGSVEVKVEHDIVDVGGVG